MLPFISLRRGLYPWPKQSDRLGPPFDKKVSYRPKEAKKDRFPSTRSNTFPGNTIRVSYAYCMHTTSRVSS